MPSSENIQFHIEIIKKKCEDNISDANIINFVKQNISRMLASATTDTIINNIPACLHKFVEQITCNGKNYPFDINQAAFYAYRLNEEGPTENISDFEADGDAHLVPASNNWILPTRQFSGLWESLLYDDNIKENLLKFIQTAMLFSLKNVDQNVISCNRLILLHGPPGTGKTSLCKALAQKISIRMKSHYRFFHLVEINSHNLFSKWFSESGKLVMKLFNHIQDLIDTKSTLVCVLIDEVESIAFSRGKISTSEPSDSLRVVNAVLTQLDKIRKHPNVLILTTSNLTSTVDLAFIDRVDIKQYIGNPSIEAIYKIYISAIEELCKAGIITSAPTLLSYQTVNLLIGNLEESQKDSLHLLQITKQSIGLSGRTLRKIPFIAHALFLETPTVSLSEFLNAMEYSVEKNLNDAKNLSKNSMC